MRNKIRLYEYDSSKPNLLGKEWSDKVSYGYTIQTVIDETLPEYQITLVGTNLPQRFQAGYKFIMFEFAINSAGEEIAVGNGTHHLIVKDDFCDRIRMQKRTTFTHRITFSSASLLAQKATCDNFAITYKLQDVNLDMPKSFDPNATVNAFVSPAFGQAYSRYLSEDETTGKNNSLLVRTVYTWEYQYRYEWIWKNGNADRNQWSNFSRNRSPVSLANNKVLITLPLPLLKIQGDRTPYSATSDVQEVYARYRARVWRKPRSRPNDRKTYIDWNGTGLPFPDQNNIPISANEYVRQNNNYGGENWSTASWNNPMVADSSGGLAAFVRAVGDGTQATTRTFAKINENANFPNSPRVVQFYATTEGTWDAVSGTYIQQQEFTYGIDLAFEPIAGSAAQFPFRQSFYQWWWEAVDTGILGGLRYDLYEIATTPHTPINQSNPVVTLEFNVYPHETEAEIFTQSAVAYSLDKFIEKAVYCTRQYYSNQEIEYVIDPVWLPKLEAVNTIETFYNNKNLWEVLLSAGNYIHAIPFLRFTNDDKLEISFRELGRVDSQPNNSTRLSVFNSQNVSDYICTLDSTVTNLVQLGSEIEEVLLPITNNGEFLVYNGSCVLKTTKPMIEVISLRVGLKSTPNKMYDITGRIVEESIYRTLDNVPRSTAQRDAFFQNYKGTFIHYKNGSMLIEGLDFQSPFNQGASPTPMQGDYTIKKIIAVATGMVNNTTTTDFNPAIKIKINDYFFVIKYRTKDTLRNIVNRVDLRKYFLNNRTEKLPILVQFNNQQDRFIDSNKFGLNTYGNLLKVGNTVYVQDEYNNNFLTIKRAGELYEIDNRLAYVAKVTHTVWQNHIISHVEYSIDYNQLSRIIGIPSEPRFYEISEQSSIDRETVSLDLVQLGTSRNQATTDSDNPLSQARISMGGMKAVLNLMTTGGKFPKYAVTIFKSDNYRDAFIHAVACYSLMNTFCIEWDMVDNFSAGDMVKMNAFNEQVSWILDNITSVVLGNTADSAYATLLPIKYCDEFGRADLLEFYILNDFDFSKIPNSTIPDDPSTVNRFNDYGFQTIPKVTLREMNIANPDYGRTLWQPWLLNMLFDKSNPDQNKMDNSFAISTSGKVIDPNTQVQRGRSFVQDALYDNAGYILKKDNREVIKCNYNVSLITDSDRFILTNKVFENASITYNQDGSANFRRQSVRIALFRQELNKFENGFISLDAEIANCSFDKFFYNNLSTTEVMARFNIAANIFAQTTAQQREECVAIALYDEGDQDEKTGMRKVYLGRNVGNIIPPDGSEIDPNTQPPALNEAVDSNGLPTANNTAVLMQYYKFSDWYLSYVKQETFRRQ